MRLEIDRERRHSAQRAQMLRASWFGFGLGLGRSGSGSGSLVIGRGSRTSVTKPSPLLFGLDKMVRFHATPSCVAFLSYHPTTALQLIR